MSNNEENQEVKNNTGGPQAATAKRLEKGARQRLEVCRTGC